MGPAFRTWTACLLAGLLTVASACGEQSATLSSSRIETKTIAILRAVPSTPSTIPALLDELRAAGFSQGLNLTVLGGDPEATYPDADDARAVVEEWQGMGVDLILALSSGGARAALDASDVHVLFISNDPLTAGLVDDEQRPGGRATGVTFRVPPDRTLDLARRLLPDLESVGIAVPEDDPAAAAHLTTVQTAGDELGIELVVETFGDDNGVRAAVGRVAEKGVGALWLSNSPAASLVTEETGAAAEELRLPVISNSPLAPWALVALTPDTDELGRQLGRQAARLLSRSTVQAVPVEDPRRFVLTLNTSVADDLGIEIPDGLLREATVVIP
ncbi:MAG TPA: ABC transporter substrate-binding protein [Acidimicrobiia bacterium]|nr:ABC transporter substrate-binding protein [Acidimicrobiia bacterium]